MTMLHPQHALMLIDFQDAIHDAKWGRRGQPFAEQNAAKLLKAWRQARAPVIHIRHDSREPDSPYRPGQPGHQFQAALRPLEGETVIGKSTNSAFVGTGLVDHLSHLQIQTLVVAGVLLENSVETTVRMGGNLGYRMILVADATASLDRTDTSGAFWTAEQVHALTLSILDGEYAEIVSTSSLLSAEVAA